MTFDHARRRLARAAVAGIPIPPVERRSPASSSGRTRTRSCSIWMLARSPVGTIVSAGLCASQRVSAGGAADDDEDDHEADDAPGDLHDVLGPGIAPSVDEVALHL